MKRFYRLADRVPLEDRERLGVPEAKAIQTPHARTDGQYIRALRTLYFREPHKGEWYLSGSTPMAYRAPNDLSTKYQILKLVLVERTTRAVYKDVTP